MCSNPVSVLFLLSLFAIRSSTQVLENKNHHDARIAWNPSTLTLIQPGGVYGRMVRLPNREILCSFERSGRVVGRRSADEGKTWSEAVLVAANEFGVAANPEMLVLRNGTVLL